MAYLKLMGVHLLELVEVVVFLFHLYELAAVVVPLFHSHSHV